MQLWFPVGVYLATVRATRGHSPVPSGVYFEASNQYFMQAVILNEKEVVLSFAHRRERSVFNIGKAPYALDPTTRTFSLYPDPTAATDSVAVAAIAKCIDRPMDFPAIGQWFPDEDRLTLNFNEKLWDMQKIPQEQDLLQLIIHDENAPESSKGLPLQYFGDLTSVQEAYIATANVTDASARNKLSNTNISATSAAAKGFITSTFAAISVAISLMALVHF